MIYIDPPYNTGGDFIYKDNFHQNKQAFDVEQGVIDAEGNRLVANPKSNGRFHSDWCSMMYSRLLLARELLTDDGVIFISIDDNEQAHLKLICDEVFGEGNFVANFIWHSKRKPSGNTTEVKKVDTRTEYILCYSKGEFVANKYINTSEELKEKGYELKDEHFAERGFYKLTPLMRSCSATSFQYIESLDYEIQAPDETMFKNHKNIEKPKSYRYTWSKKLFDFGFANGFIEVVKNTQGHWVAYRKMYEHCSIDNKTLQIIYRKSGNAYTNLLDHVTSDTGSNELRKLLDGEKVFPTPKSIGLVSHLCKIATNENDLILDFFSGSATTAHAVMQLNAQDGGKRKWIMVQLPEACDEKSTAYQAGYKNICEIGKERIRRAGEKIINDQTLPEENRQNLDIGFRVLSLDSTNKNNVQLTAQKTTQLNLMESNIKTERSNLDLFFESLLDWGVGVNSDYQTHTVGKAEIHCYNHGALVACFDPLTPAVIQKLSELHQQSPIMRLVLLNASFERDDEFINCQNQLKRLLPHTEIRVI